MKKVNKILLSVFAAFAMVILLKVPVDAAARQTTCTSTSITIQWDKPTIYSNETFVCYNLSTSYNGTPFYQTADINNTQYTINNVANYSGYVYVTYTYYTNYGGPYTFSIGSTNINTLPATATTSNFVTDSVLYNTKKVSFKVSQNPSASGFELELYKNGKLVNRQTSSIFSTGYLPVSYNATYQYRIRYYTKNSSNGVTYYSASWSPMRKFCLPYYTGKAKSNKKGFSLTLKKATGVSKYLVYVSKKSSKSGFKKVASVSLGKKSKKTIQIAKSYKKRARNYIRIVPVFKDGSKSDIIGTGSIYIYK